MRTSLGPWDHEAFQDFVVKHAFSHGIEGRRALGEAANIKVGLLSKWYRGVERPSPESIKKLAPVLRVPASDLMVLTGHLPADGAELTPIPEAPEFHPLARELNTMLAPDSPLTDARRDLLADSVDRIMEPDRKTMLRSRRQPA